MADFIQRRLVRLSAMALGAAVLVLIAGLTILEPRLHGIVFLWYWVGCFALVGAAILAALLDLWRIRRQARAARRQLVQSVFGRRVLQKTHRSEADSDRGRRDSSDNGEDGD